MPGSGISLPLDLKHIASRCVGSYFAPKRFAAVQLAFATPRCRVLVFHTGRLVGTGTSSASAARLAIARAQRQLADQAGVHVHVRNFQVRFPGLWHSFCML
jgi:TATA-box binding protein (TBP) (component of TFIID and TFIIIB)